MSARWTLVLALLALSTTPLRAQQPAAAAPDTTLTPEQRLLARQREMLERLSRPAGQDTLIVVDSAAAPPFATPLPGTGSAFDAAGDTILEQMSRQFPGVQPVQYRAGSALFEAGTRNLYLYADTAQPVILRYEAGEVTADTSIVYNDQREILEARGNPLTTFPEGDPIRSRQLRVDTRTQEASALGAETRYTEGNEWLVTGDLPRVGRDLVFASHAKFTSCTLDEPHYHFGAEHIKIIRGNILVAAPVTLYFADVPVFWLPFIAQSLASGRSSGILTPRFSINDVVRSSGGYQRRISNVGFYWAMSRFTDATIALDWFSGNFTSLTASMRYRWLPQFLNGTISARRFWRDEGGTEFSLNGQHAWELSERASMTASLAYVSSTSFLRRNTFDPLEATQRITSSGGFTRRFDWGQLNVFADRAQSLSDDRVEMTLPRATLSLKTTTLFAAPESRARFYNNLTWSGGGSLSRRVIDLPLVEPGQEFRFGALDRRQLSGSANHSLGFGNFSFGQDVRFEQGTLLGVPFDTLPHFPEPLPGGLVDLRQSNFDWSTSLSYQQQLVGTTSITPNITVSSSALRSDTIDVASGFVTAPMRISFGASLNSHLYGFFPGFGPFEAMRHRISPGFNYQWSPAVEPTDLQRAAFGASTLRTQSRLGLSLSQTFEAKRRPDAAATGAPAPGVAPADSLTPAPAPLPVGEPGAPTRRPQGEIVTLLALHTSSLSYDFVEADSTGQFLQGFTTTRLRNEVESDFLRGLTLSFEHDLFRDSTVAGLGTDFRRERAFDPHLSEVNLRFSLDASSALFRFLGLGSDSVAPVRDPFDPRVSDPYSLDDPFAARRGATDDSSILPGRVDPAVAARAQNEDRSRRGWDASVAYALTRPRRLSTIRENSQTIRLSVNTQPTDLWSMSWRTAYDVESGRFSDHMVTLTRDLHRWQAHFDFMKTATGNWAFRFEVSLLDNNDLHFDFDQRSAVEEVRLPR